MSEVKGLCPACGNTGLIEEDNGDKTRCEDCYEKRIIKTAKLQTLGDVEKALPTVNNLKNLLKYGVKSDISEHDFNVFTVAEKIDSKYKDIIKNLREAL